LTSVETVDEFVNLKRILILSNLSSIHHYIGGTNLMNKPWYWVATGNEMTLNSSMWHTGGPNGQHLDEFCTDFLINHETKDYSINDAPCRSISFFWNFICEEYADSDDGKNNPTLPECKSSAITIISCVIIILCLFGKIGFDFWKTQPRYFRRTISSFVGTSTPPLTTTEA
jgi:hypothetical protein